MIEAGRLVLFVTLAAALASGCGPKKARSAPTRSSEALVVLLPDAESGTTGKAQVSNAAGAANLTAARESTIVLTGQKPGAVTVLSEAEINRLFGDALAALPAAPRHFTLYFRFESDELTEESRALVPEILNTVKQRPVPEVVVVGHTDTMGGPKRNVGLGMKRAVTVRDLLIGAGLDRALIEVTSHGERDLLIETPDETPEPRNRRVEISVR
jgi:outer membrane protein OmpA-like peptidoglycan-associated protein